MCKPPGASSKTRLARDLGAKLAARLGAAFLRDTAAAILAAGAIAPMAPICVHWPPDAAALRPLLPEAFAFLPQRPGDLGRKMHLALSDLLAQGHRGAMLIGADLPSLPPEFLVEAADVLTSGAADVVLGPALDGGYYLIGMHREPPAGLFSGIPWSTPAVLALTLERAVALDLSVHLLPQWYDVDDALSFAMLTAHLNGCSLPRIAALPGPAPAMRELLASPPPPGRFGR